MINTLSGFKWDNKDDRSWLTKYFTKGSRKPKSEILIPNIKVIRHETSQELFELFFENLLHSTKDDKRIRKNVIAAWKRKVEQRENHKQLNIGLTSDDRDKLISLKNRNGKKATIKDTILDLIYNEYCEHQDIRRELEKEIRKEIAQEMRTKARVEVPKRNIKAPVELEAIYNDHQEEQNVNKAQVENQIIEKIEALTNETNAKFDRLESMLSKLIKHQEQQLKKKDQCSTLQTETTPEKKETNESELQSDNMPLNDKFKTKKTPYRAHTEPYIPIVNEYDNYEHLRLTATSLNVIPPHRFQNSFDQKLKD